MLLSMAAAGHFLSCDALWWLLLLWSSGSRVVRLLQWWHMGSVALQHVGSSQTRNQTHVPCTGRQILNHWTTRKVPPSISWPLGFDCKAKLTNRTGLGFCVAIST